MVLNHSADLTSADIVMQLVQAENLDVIKIITCDDVSVEGQTPGFLNGQATAMVTLKTAGFQFSLTRMNTHFFSLVENRSVIHLTTGFSNSLSLHIFSSYSFIDLP